MKRLIIILLIMLLTSFCIVLFIYLDKQNNQMYQEIEKFKIKYDVFDIKEDIVELKIEEESDTEDITVEDNKINESQTNYKSEDDSKQEVIIESNSNVEINNHYHEQENNVSSDNVENTNQEEIISKPSYIGVPSPNDFYYSIHHGVIEYTTMEDCLNAGIEIGFKDTVDIRNTSCYDIIDDDGTVLGEYLQIVCYSGDCDKYKN